MHDWWLKELVAVFGKVIFGRDDKTAVDSFNDIINELLFVFETPINLIVFTCSKVYYYVFVPKEKHNCAGVEQLVHDVEIRYF